MRYVTFVILWIGCLTVAATSIRGTWFPAPGPKPAPFSKVSPDVSLLWHSSLLLLPAYGSLPPRLPFPTLQTNARATLLTDPPPLPLPIVQRIRDQMKKDEARGSSSSGKKGKKGKKGKEDGEDEGAPWLFLALLVGAGIFATRDKLKAVRVVLATRPVLRMGVGRKVARREEIGRNVRTHFVRVCTPRSHRTHHILHAAHTCTPHAVHDTTHTADAGGARAVDGGGAVLGQLDRRRYGRRRRRRRRCRGGRRGAKGAARTIRGGRGGGRGEVFLRGDDAAGRGGQWPCGSTQ
jgi:hypothetical protein